MMYHASMMDNLELEDRRPNSAVVNVPLTPPLLDAKDDSRGGGRAQQDRPEPSSGTTHCLWCGRAFTPRSTGGSPQRFCSSGHRQAFWVAARRWIMKAVQAGLLSTECLKVP